MDLKLHTEDSLRTAADTFVTFLYAAAVHLVIAHFASPGPMTTGLALIVLCLILFLFSDWLSRVRLPWLLPAGDQVGVGSQLAKTVLEVGGLFFLVIAWLAFIESHDTEVIANTEAAWDFWLAHVDPYLAFAVFLFATFAWNLFMLRVMRKLTWLDLARMTMNGDALDSDKVELYAKRFWQYRQKLEASVAAATKRGTENTLYNFAVAQRALFREAVTRSVAQIVALHIAWSSVIAGTLILLGTIFSKDKSSAAMITLKVAKMEWPPFVFALLGGLFLAFAIPFVLNQFRGWKRCLIYSLAFCLFIVFSVWLSIRLATLSQFRLMLCWFSGILLIPTGTFWISSQIKNAARKRLFLFLSGTLGALSALLLYLTIRPTTLLVVVAVQQVLVNAFLQYAASEHPINVEIYPPTAELKRGGSTKFRVTVIGTTNTKVKWSADGGGITADGLFTAPNTEGNFVVTAAPEADPGRAVQATVTVTG
jgi:hypothetical protein